MSRHRRRTSTGDMISSIAFLGAGLWLLSDALETDGWRGWALLLCALASLAAALRHPAARLLTQLSDRRAETIPARPTLARNVQPEDDTETPTDPVQDADARTT